MASRFQFTGVDKAVRRLNRLAERTKTATVAAAAFNAVLGPGGPLVDLISKSGGTYALNQSRWNRRKAALGYSGNPLQASGRLLTALSQKLPPKFGTKKGLKFGLGKQPTVHGYIQPVVFGGRPKRRKTDQWAALGAVDFGAKKRNIPQRRFMFWRNSDAPAVRMNVQQALAKIFRTGGF